MLTIAIMSVISKYINALHLPYPSSLSDICHTSALLFWELPFSRNLPPLPVWGENTLWCHSHRSEDGPPCWHVGAAWTPGPRPAAPLISSIICQLSSSCLTVSSLLFLHFSFFSNFCLIVSFVYCGHDYRNLHRTGFPSGSFIATCTTSQAPISWLP